MLTILFWRIIDFFMNLTSTAFGTWSGGRFMHFGETLSEEHFMQCVQLAYEKGMRTFVTADAYGALKADALLAKALRGIPRETYCLVGMVGHDIHHGKRQGSKGWQRYTDPELRSEAEFADFLSMATQRSLEACETDYFDLCMLHNPSELGYISEKNWQGMADLKEQGLAQQIGIAPGPANGFTLDLIKCFEDYKEIIDWAMLILSPMEPWPTNLVLPVAEACGIDVLTRVVDHGGVFYDDLKPGHEFKPGDHRAYRPQGWIELGNEKMEKMRPIAEKYGVSMIQLAALWNLSQPAVKSTVPTFLQEHHEGAIPIEEKIGDLANLPEIRLTAEDSETIRAIGDNTGCMALKGASQRHTSSERPDEWPMRADLLEITEKYNLGAF